MTEARTEVEPALPEVYVNADGKRAMRLTDDGVRVARQMAMSKDSDAVLTPYWRRSRRRRRRPARRGSGH